MSIKKRLLFAIATALVAALMVPAMAFADTCSEDHNALAWNEASSGSFEHFKKCPGCGCIVDRGNHVDADGNRVCDVCGVDELVKVTYDYEDPSKADVVLLYEKGSIPYHYASASVDYDQKEGYVSKMWEISYEKTPEGSLSEDSNGQTTVVADGVVMVARWKKVYETITFSFEGYELGADVTGGTLTDDIDGYEPESLPAEIGGGKYAIVLDKDGLPDTTDPDTTFNFAEGKFEAGVDYWLMVIIGGGNVTGDIVVSACGIEDYFLASPECVDKHHIVGGEAEIAFFKLKPLENSEGSGGAGDSSSDASAAEKPVLAQSGDATPITVLMIVVIAAATAAFFLKRKIA